MKKLFICLIIITPIFLNGQDLIIKTDGDSTKCIITNQDSVKIYLTIDYKGKQMPTFLKKDQVKQIQFSFYNKKDKKVNDSANKIDSNKESLDTAINNNKIKEKSSNNIKTENKTSDLQSIKRYDRSSLSMMLIKRSDQNLEYQPDIEEGYQKLEIPDKYDEIKVNDLFVLATGKKDRASYIENLLKQRGIARELVAKWFNRKNDGTFDMTIVSDRAFYNATERDVSIAKLQARGLSAIGDYGENLIGNTFVLVNEITYFDKEKAGKTAASGFRILGALADIGSFVSSTFFGTDISSYTDKIQLGSQIGALTSEILAKGFNVTITSYLFKLEWNEKSATIFYSNYYTEKPDDRLKRAFDNSSEFSLKYVGSYKEKASIQSTIFSASTQDELILKTLNEALDKNIRGLQQRYEIFRVKTPLIVKGSDYNAKIGLKEGISRKSRFEVLESIDNNGVREYKKKGMLKPINNQIWDNRFMAHLGQGEYKGNTSISSTHFIKKSGGELYNGMLLREMKSNINGWYFRIDVALSFGSAYYKYFAHCDVGDYRYREQNQEYVWESLYISKEITKTKDFTDYRLSLELGRKTGKFNFGIYGETF